MAKKRPPQKFAICLSSEGYDDLEARKLYSVLWDAKAHEEGLLRVVDESGEDYLYPADRFLIVEFKQAAEQKLLDALIGSRATG
jgi:hypothetical protein